MKWWQRLINTVKRPATAAMRITFVQPVPIHELLLDLPAGDNMLPLGPTSECLCGSDLFVVVAWFRDKDMAGWFTDARCLACGTVLRAPTPVDVEPAA